MRASFAITTTLLTAAWASPHPHSYLHRQKNGYGLYENGTHPSAQLSGRPFPSAVGTAPQGSDSTTIVTRERTVQVTVTVAPVPTPTPNDNLVVTETTPTASATEKDIESKPKLSAKPDTCKLETVTVTYAPTVTVTVTESKDENEASTVSSPPVQPSKAASHEDEDQHAKALPPRPVVSPSSVTPKPEVKATPAAAKASDSAKEEAPEKADTPPVKTETLVPIPKASEAPPAPAPVPQVSKAPTTAPDSPSVPLAKPGNKRGIFAPGSESKPIVAAFNKFPKITWVANWYSGAPPDLDSHIEFVPQNYGKESDVAPDYGWTHNAKHQIEKGAKNFISFGEPETPNDKLHMEPPEAVDLFLKKMQPYANDVRLGSPTVTQPDRDLAWLSKFLELCDAAGCSISFVCVHWIWEAKEERIEDFKSTITKAIKIANGRPVWVDNFQANGSDEDQRKFLSGVLPWLESNPNVERYAYVSPARKTGTGFLNADGSISALGEFYANF